VRTYKAKNQEAAAQAFQHDAASLAAAGYVPVSQSWAQGTYGCGSFLIALLLCILIIGFLIFIGMLFVKPDGTLTVTYQYREENQDVPAGGASSSSSSARMTKRCPRCAEDVLAEATACRFCGNEFTAPDPEANINS
jgi:hypothetical protein